MIDEEIKILKTSCEGCIFNKANCLLGYSNFIEPTKYNINAKWIEGYCHDKRSKQWLESSHKDIAQATKAMLYNNNDDLTVIIIFDESTLNNLKNTINSILKLKEFDFKHFVIAIKQAPSDLCKQIIRLMPKILLDKKWSVEKFIHGQEIPLHYYLMDWCLRHIKTSWFLTLYSGDMLSVNEEKSDNIFDHDNSVAYYFDKADPVRVFFHKQVFDELKGNAEQPCLEKIQSFSNWREVCHKIKSKLQLSRHVSDTENGSEDTLTLYSIKK